MHLEGQGSVGLRRLSSRPYARLDDGGFTMVVLLVVMAIMAVGMTAMLPTWRQQAIREHEEELIFRGNQYARAIVLYSRKNNNLLPANIDLLYEGKYLRKKWKDPITGENFGLLPAGQPVAAGRGAQGPGGATGGAAAPQAGGARGGGTGSAFGGQQVIGSIQGVYSTSTDTSIRVYQNQQRYIDWQFTFQTALPTMGGAAGGAAGGRQGGAPGGRQGGVGGADGRGGTGIGGNQGRGGQPAGGRGLQPIAPPGQGRGGAAPPPTGRGRGGGLGH